MHRSYCPNLDLNQQTATITDKQELHHLKNVLRAKPKTKISLLNGSGQEAEGEIISISSKFAEVKILSCVTAELPKPDIILACAMPKKSKFETIIEKATELGVSSIIPLNTKRTEVSLSPERLTNKIIRYQAVALNAAKQSKRSTIPTINPISTLEETVETLMKDTVIFIPSLLGKTLNILDSFEKNKNPEKIAFLIGPEGDFTEEEYNFAHNNNCIGISLGKTILKVETAALCAVACANQFYWKQ
ncbi:MAG: 16S rRNA (uracil(1498)-N(3))-methyltransferase [Candidatus Omnitrophica bacterium]|nr:16S rRNA (uracil(1498)-N(3))-methyltransferase [Candidatus Omnitrophota bacterium]MBU1995687.1 16S rRNA (uracil(1498)-N(3))-methyltransferase [Candidatus Omnitrophota bacterium]MBU4333020.1 16S rRNA (uracil(1498)-N(3))-methyltransferase [Candidatus Omnitrophota bacterium]